MSVQDIIEENKARMRLAESQFNSGMNGVNRSINDMNRAADNYVRAVEEKNRIERKMKEKSGKSAKSKKGGGFITAVIVILLLSVFLGEGMCESGRELERVFHIWRGSNLQTV